MIKQSLTAGCLAFSSAVSETPFLFHCISLLHVHKQLFIFRLSPKLVSMFQELFSMAPPRSTFLEHEYSLAVVLVHSCYHLQLGLWSWSILSAHGGC